MNKPNFFIIGAPRAATTFMQKNLDRHPDIFMAPGEPSFFAPDYVKPWLNKEEYLNLFQKANNYKVAGEKTVFYLPSEIAIKKIIDFNPQAKILVMIRNPIEAAYSFHSKMVSVGRENITDFKKAWELKDKRKNNFYQGKLKISALNYGEIYKVGKHLERVFSTVSKEQIRVILFDDLVESEKRVYKQTLKFLGVSSEFNGDFSKVNPNRQPRLKIVNRLFSLRGILPIKRVKKILGIKREIGFFKKIRSLNQTKKRRKPLPIELKRELADYFENDIKLLAELIDRDLDHWLDI